MSKPISLYFHIPYCRRKCLYCDFYSGGVRIADWGALKKSFIRELEARREEYKDHTIVSLYFGGGTPSLIPAPEFEALIKDIRRILSKDAGMADDCEFTIEVNPEDVTQDRIKAWKRSGVNRVSLGIQTFDDTILSIIGRDHSGDEAISAFQALNMEFENISADLIFGLPGQTIPHLKSDLTKLTALHPTHISVYSLMYEPGTSITHLRNTGKVKPVEDEVAEEMFLLITDTLTKSGYDRYETSNYALQGYESRHNSGYWTGRPYIGIGPAAHSYDGKFIRKANPADLKGYLTNNYKVTEEKLTRRELIEERIMLGLRMKKGIDLNAFRNDFGDFSLEQLMKKAQNGLRSRNFEMTDSHLRITDTGLMISDRLIIELF